jgi:hypothetical protein
MHSPRPPQPSDGPAPASLGRFQSVHYIPRMQVAPAVKLQFEDMLP